MSNLRNDTSGYTIVELLVTIIVGGLLTSSVVLILGSHSNITQRGRDVAVANAYAENKIESLRSTGFLGLADGTTDLTNELPAELKNPRSGSLVISSYTTAIKRADISITYSDQGAARTYSYSTYIGELGVGQY
jgi:type II secretory pathway pseudopilin PulG